MNRNLELLYVNETQTPTLNINLTFLRVWVEMTDVRVMAEMSKTIFSKYNL